MILQINNQVSVATLISQVQRCVRQYTDNEQIINEIVIVASEIIYNIIKFAPNGQLIINYDATTPPKIKLSAQDNGQGFGGNFDVALQEGFSTANSLGLGLPSIIRLCDDVQIKTSTNGTVIECSKEL